MKQEMVKQALFGGAKNFLKLLFSKKGLSGMAGSVLPTALAGSAGGAIMADEGEGLQGAIRGALTGAGTGLGGFLGGNLGLTAAGIDPYHYATMSPESKVMALANKGALGALSPTAGTLAGMITGYQLSKDRSNNQPPEVAELIESLKQ